MQEATAAHTPPIDLIVILGATTTGKTRLAHQLARQVNGELINADKFYLFDGPSIGTGRADIEAHPDIVHHLYGVIPVRAAKPTVGMWMRALTVCVEDIHRRGRVAIVEGSSFGLASAAARWAAGRPGGRVLGVRWAHSPVLSEKVAARIEAAWEVGLVEETARALSMGLGNSWVLRRSVVYPSVVAHLHGSVSASAAREQIAARVLHAARQQNVQFQGLSGVQWLETPATTAVASAVPELAFA